jgi:hypothetical protein
MNAILLAMAKRRSAAIVFTQNVAKTSPEAR